MQKLFTATIAAIVLIVSGCGMVNFLKNAIYNQEIADFVEFTHEPVDFSVVFDTVTCGASTGNDPMKTPITRFFEYWNTSHPEGPRKWYIHPTDNENLGIVMRF